MAASIWSMVLIAAVWAPERGWAQVPAAPTAAPTSAASAVKEVVPGEVQVVLGRSTVLKTSFDTVQEPVVSSDKVCRVQRIGKGSILVSGLALGSAQVTVAQDGAPAGVETYVVRVVRDAQEFSKLADFINANVPNCKITLTLSPDTRKVLLGGYVWTQEALRQIYELLVSPDLPQSDIVNQLYWAYPPSTGPVVCPTS